MNLRLPLRQWLDEDDSLQEEALAEKIREAVRKDHEEKNAGLPDELARRLEKDLMLDTLDRHWKEHLVAMDHLRQGIGLRGYAAKNPKQEYKREAFDMFSDMLENIKRDVITLLAKVHIGAEQDLQWLQRRAMPVDMQFNHPDAPNALGDPAAADAPMERPQQKPYIRGKKKIGRNEPCPCGSGKKYKHCHGRLS